MNNTKKRQVEIAKNMLEVEIPMEDIVEMSGLTMEEVQKLSKEVQIRVRDTTDVVDFDLLDTMYHYGNKTAKDPLTNGAPVQEDEQ